MRVERLTRCTVGEVAAPSRNALVGGPFGSDLVSRDYVVEGVPVIRGVNMGNGRWIGGDFVCVTQQKADSLSANCAKPGDLVFTQRGTLGQVALVPKGRANRYLISQSQMKLTADPEKADSLYLYYVFTGAEQQEYIRQNAIQTGVPHTNLGILRRTPLDLPSLAEQRAIAAVLGALDDKIELNQRMNATLEATVRTLFQSWFVDFDPVRANLDGRQPPGLDAATAALFPDTFEESAVGHVPAGWRVAPVGEVVACVGGATPSTAESRFWEGGVHHWTTPKDFSSLKAPILIDTERRLTDAGVSKISSGLLPVGTVLLSSRAPVGYLALAAIPVAINQGFIGMKCNERASNYFMLNWCQSNMAEIEGRATGTTFAEISKQNFRPIPLVLPSREIMAVFTDTVAPFYDRITANLYESRTLAALRDGLLPRLLSGEVRVPVADAIVLEHSVSNVVPFPEVAPPKKANDEFVEAVVIARLVKLLANPEYPLGRFRYNKLAYLAHRKVEDDTTKHYLKKAAGPYSPWAKYSGPEAIAKRNGYVREVTINGRKGFLPADKIEKIEPYVAKYAVCAAVDWVAGLLRYRKNDDLELLATVDFAAVELAQTGHAVSLETVKWVIATNAEWAPKLKREIFSDEKIAAALVELAEIYPSLYKS